VLRSRVYTGSLERRNGEVLDGTHRALIDAETWGKVERAEHATLGPADGGRRTRSEHLLTNGLLVCGRCGSAMFPRSRTRENPRYVCGGRVQHGPDYCSQPSVLRNAVDEPLRQALSEGYLADVENTLAGWREARSGELALAREAHNHAKREVERIERRRDRVVEGWQDRVLTYDDYRRQVAGLDAERPGAKAAEQQTAARVRELEREVAESDLEPIRDSLDALKRADLDEFRRISRSMFATVELVPLTSESASPGLQVVQTEDGPALLSLPTSRGEGVIEHDGTDAEVTDGGRRYWLVPRLRPEYVEGDAVVRQPLPQSGPNDKTGWLGHQSATTEHHSSARRSATARASSMSV
jgi:hypothetical protein